MIVYKGGKGGKERVIILNSCSQQARTATRLVLLVMEGDKKTSGKEQATIVRLERRDGKREKKRRKGGSYSRIFRTDGGEKGYPRTPSSVEGDHAKAPITRRDVWQLRVYSMETKREKKAWHFRLKGRGDRRSRSTPRPFDQFGRGLAKGEKRESYSFLF